MIHQFISHVQQQHLFPSGQQVLLAVSGGIDSVVLAHLMHQAGYPFAIAHCNFHLRSSDSDRDELFVRQLAQTYNVPIHVAQFSTSQFAAQHHLCIEDAARRLRYDYFEQLCQQYHYAAILTAHHRDDAAETFFINLLRGTGLTGLHGILPVQGNVVRPLLPFGREQIEAYARQHQLDHVEDVTNASLQYRRNQVRHQVMPLLRQIQPSADKAIQSTITHLQSIESLYRHLLQPLLQSHVMQAPDGTLHVTLDFLDQPYAQQLLFEILSPYGFNGSVVDDMLASTQSGKVFHSAAYTAILDRGQLILTPVLQDSDVPDLATFSYRIVDQFDFSSLPLRQLPSNQAFFDADSVVLPISLRHWHEGDRFQPLGMTHGTQLVSDYFSDHKYTILQKQEQLLLVDANNTVLWIVGRRTTHPHRVTPSTRALLIVEVDVSTELR